MAQKKFLDLDGLLYFWNKLKGYIDVLGQSKVDKVEGKGLSTNDLTDELKEKILNAGTGSFTGVYKDLVGKPKINNVEVDGEMTLDQLGIQAKGDYALKSELPTKVSQLENDNKYQTETQVATSIATAISGITHFHFEKVEELPEAGDVNVIYLVAKESGKGYKEWLFVDGQPEEIGDTDIDLSNYLQNSDLIAITNNEIDNITN